MDVERSPDTLYRLIRVRESQGATAKDAHARAKNVTTQFRQEGDVLLVSPLASYPKSDKIRGQHARFTLQLPEGKAVFLRANARAVINDIKNVEDVWDSDMLGKAWRMTSRGLEEDKPVLEKHDDQQEKDDSSGTGSPEQEGTIEASNQDVAIKLPSIIGLLRLRV